MPKASVKYLLVALVTLILFQNCSIGYETNTGGSGASNSSSNSNILGSQGQPSTLSFATAPRYNLGQLEISLSIPFPLSQNALISWTATDGTALFGEHFGQNSGTITLFAGQTSTSFLIPVLKSGVNPLNFTVHLSSYSAGQIGASSQIATIPASALPSPFSGIYQIPSQTGLPSRALGPSTMPWIAHWTQNKWLVIGESPSAGPLQGYSYEPASNQWTSLNMTGGPQNLYGFASATDGKRLFIFGGYTYDFASQTLANTNRGYIFDPILNQWTPMSLNGAPSARTLASMTWTGKNFLIFGGYVRSSLTGQLSFVSDHASYDPTANTWTTLPALNAPSPRNLHFATWTGERMVILGGSDSPTGYNPYGNPQSLLTGSSFDPTNNVWTKLPDLPTGSRTYSWTTAWTGNKILTVYSERIGGSRPPEGGIITTYAVRAHQASLGAGSSWTSLDLTNQTMSNDENTLIGNVAKIQSVQVVQGKVLVFQSFSQKDPGFIYNLDSGIISAFQFPPTQLPVRNKFTGFNGVSPLAAGVQSNGHSILIIDGRLNNTGPSSLIVN